MEHSHVVSSNPKSTVIPQVDRLLTGPPDLGSHTTSRSHLAPSLVKEYLLGNQLILVPSAPGGA